MENKSLVYDLIILGGGAAGMLAALTAAAENKELDILIIEKNENLGRKLLATGNGRCNFSNMDQSLDHYRSTHPELAQRVLSAFDLEATLKFFDNLGLQIRNEEGRLYPRSNEGKIVPRLFAEAIRKAGIALKLQTNIVRIEKLKRGFELFSSEAECFRTKKLILTPGGKATPVLGSDGYFFPWLKANGHKIIEPEPVLLPLKLNLPRLKRLSGTRFSGWAQLKNAQDRVLKDVQGEFLFTNYGISGIPILEISRFAVQALSQNQNVYLLIDFLPEFKQEKIGEDWLDLNQEELVLALSGFVHSKIAEYLMQMLIESKGPIAKLNREQKEYLTELIHEFKAEVRGYLTFKEAQSTMGGVRLSEVKINSLESKYIQDCFLAGEVLDVDGNCGGYNLQWAWSSGFLAGKSVASDFK